MPPQVTYCQPLVTPRTPLLYRVSPNSRFKRILHRKYCRGGGGRMKFTKMKLIMVLVFILFGASLFRFLNISMIANLSVPLFPAALPPINQNECSSSSSTCQKNLSYPQAPSRGGPTSINNSSLTKKEMQFLLKFFSPRLPCNLLVFGNEYHYSSIASLNSGGFTIFLEDYLQHISTRKSTNNAQVHRIMYNTVASDAYQLLKDARENPECWLKLHMPKASKCNLALLNLPQEVYDTIWDVVVVDGPSGGSPDSPGRMASIYTASLIARRGNTTHVIVHDVDRMIEKWFSWEFLCEENLVSSKGRFWNFRIQGETNASTFCTK